MPAGTPGTTSNGTPAAATATASCTTESTVSGSPLTSRVTRRPSRAAATRSRGHVGGLPDRRPHLGVRRRERQDRLRDVRVGDDSGARGQGLAGAHGQQAGVAGAAAHELDPPRGDGGCSVHLGTLISEAGDPGWGGGVRQVEQLGGQRQPELLGVVHVRRRGRAQQRPVVGAEHGAQRDPVDRAAVVVEVGDDVGQRPDRGAAAGLQGGEQGALGGHRGPGVLVVQRGGQRAASSGRVGRRPGTPRPARPGPARAASAAGRAARWPRRSGPAGAARRRPPRPRPARRSRPCRSGCPRCRGSARRPGPARARRAGPGAAASRCRRWRRRAARRAPCRPGPPARRAGPRGAAPRPACSRGSGAVGRSL